MTRKMTVVFHDEGLYTDLKVEAVRRRKTASDIVSEAVREWLERREDAELLPAIGEVRSEWLEKGGRPWDEVEHEIEEEVAAREAAVESKKGV